jgi:hypothetical protein
MKTAVMGNVYNFLDIRVEITSNPKLSELAFQCVIGYPELEMDKLSTVDVRISGPFGTSQLTLGLEVLDSLLGSLARMVRDWGDVVSIDDIPYQDQCKYIPSKLDGLEGSIAVGAI